MSSASVLRYTCDLCGTTSEKDGELFRSVAANIPDGWYEVRPQDPAVMSLHCCGDCWIRARGNVRSTSQVVS